MNSNFLHGFADELIKEASHPLFEAVQKGGTLLGQKVKGMITRATKGKKPQLKKKASFTDGYSIGSAAKAGRVTGPKAMKAAPAKETDFGFGGTKKKTPSSHVTVGKATRLSGSGLLASSKKSLGSTESKTKSQKMGNNLMAPSFGGGTGNFEGKQAPPFTDKVNPTDVPQAFGKKKKK